MCDFSIILLILLGKEYINLETKQVKDFAPYLNVRNAIMPIFSAGSERLLFLSDITGTNQIWSIATSAGTKSSWPDQLTFFEERVTSLHPNPDRTAFLFTRDRGGDEQDQFYLLQGEVTSGLSVTTLIETPEYKNNFGAWRPDGRAYCFSSNRRHPAFFDIYTHELGSEPQLVYQADESLYAEDWSHDGRYILFRRANTNLDADLFLIDLTQPQAEPRHLTPHQTQTYFASNAFFSQDDKAVYVITDWGRDFSSPACLELATTKLTFLSDRPWNSETMALSPDGSRLAYEINEGGYSRLYIRELDSGQEQAVGGLPRGIVTGIGLWLSIPAWSPDGKRLAFSYNSSVQNADIWVYDLEGTDLYQATFSARGGLNFARFVQPELIEYPSFDGLQIPALLFLPPGAAKDRSTPFIVFVHGGPEGQTRFSWNPVLQYYVSRGYGILAPNVRGSSGYGKTYLALDDVRKRMDSVADLKAGVEWLRESGYSDPARIAVYGQSYGGFMVLAAVTTYPELWAAGVDIYGIANMLTFMENTSPYRLKMRTPEYGDPTTDRDFLIEISAIHKTDRITAPMMIIHGERDPRVPISESEQMVTALKSRNHPVEYYVFPDEGHGITKLKNKLAVYPAIADFLDRHLRPQS